MSNTTGSHPGSGRRVEFFRLKTLAEVRDIIQGFMPLETQEVPLPEAYGRVLAREVAAPEDVPAFARSTVDGYAVQARDTFGAGPGSPGLLEVSGDIAMGQEASHPLAPGQTQRIATGGMLPPGADAVVMLEYIEELDAHTMEVYRAVSPLENVIQRGEDVRAGEVLLRAGQRLRPQEIGLLAALGVTRVVVHNRPRVAIISTGDEIVPIEAALQPGQMRDANSYALAAQVQAMGGEPLLMGILPDQLEAFQEGLSAAVAQADMVLLSGGSSVGARDWTIPALSSSPDTAVLVHGVAVSPGKPTILARWGKKPVVGLPGHPASAMIIMEVLVRPLLARLAGLPGERPGWGRSVPARLSRNVASVLGRDDFIRVRLEDQAGELWAKPVLGKSGLISTLVKADGCVRIDLHREGVEQGELIDVHLFEE